MLTRNNLVIQNKNKANNKRMYLVMKDNVNIKITSFNIYMFLKLGHVGFHG